MFELIFLGTSASAPSVRRGLASALVLHKEYRFMVDCGEGTQRQLLQSGLGFKRLDKVLLTHGHLDHILGIGGLASTFGRWEMIPQMDIYGGKPALERVQAIMRIVFGPGRMPLQMNFQEIEPGVIFADDTFELRAFAVQHRGPGCFGYIFQERARRPFLAERAQAVGVPAGPLRRNLVRGEAITLADGRVIQPDDVLGPVVPGAKLVMIGDVGRLDDLDAAVENADALVIEATYLDEEREMAHAFGHVTAAQSASLAARTGVRNLILTHISRRYNARQVINEAQPIFPHVVVANDFDRFRIGKAGQLERLTVTNNE